MIIHGEQVNLRDVRPNDTADHRRWFEPDQDWLRWDAPWESPQRVAESAVEQWIDRLRQPLPAPRTRFEIETADGRHIGWVGTYWVSRDHNWRDCGVVIAETDCWGHGFGREAFTLWTDYLMRAHELPRLGIGTWSGNERMVHLAARIGMRPEACFRDARHVGKKRYDAVRWGFTRAEWERLREPPTDGLRRFTPADWEVSLELIRQLFQLHRELQQAPPFTVRDARETLYDWLARPGTALWIWQEEDEVRGLASGRQDGVTFLEALVIAESHRRRGSGGRFLVALEEKLRRAGEEDLFLSMLWPGNRPALDFYCRHGYDLINTLEMRKGLNEDRRGEPVEFLGRRFHLGRSVPAEASDLGPGASPEASPGGFEGRPA